MMDRAQLTRIQTMLDKACASGCVNAASLAVKTRADELAIACGAANSPEGIEATPDTLFHIGSVTKAITAELIWRLILDSRLSANLPVIEAAPELAHISTLTDPRLTIGHLLSHTGGLDGDVFFEAGRDKDVLRRFMSQIESINSLHAPGEHFSYANVGYNILARIVELHTGTAYEDAVSNLLRKTHWLSRFAMLPEDKIRHRTAVHFTEDEGKYTPSAFGPYSNIGSGTVLAMSMPELARWGAAHAQSSEVARRMTARAMPLPFSHRYEGWGFGFTLMDGMGTRVFGHDGGTAGTATFLRIAPAVEAAWAFAATGSAAVAVYRDIEPLIREALQISPCSHPSPSEHAVTDLQLYSGTYRRHGITLDVRQEEDGSLTLSATGEYAPDFLDGLRLRPLNHQIFETMIPPLNAKIWVSFHDFRSDGKPQLIYVLERMARRSETASR